MSNFNWKGLIFDEAHYLKNHTSQRSKLAGQLLDAVPGDPVVYALTGTPLTNRPRDLFVLLQIVSQPGKYEVVYCRVCGCACPISRAVHGPTGWASAMARKHAVHDTFACPHASRAWQ